MGFGFTGDTINGDNSIPGPILGVQVTSNILFYLVLSQIVGLYLGIPLALLGGIIDALEGTDETIHFEGMSDSEINEILDKLRKKARIRDYK